MYNENNSSTITQETDASGGNRKIEEKDNKKEVVFSGQNGANVPMTQTVVNPKIEGVVVTAEGASDASIKSNIISAVEAVTGVPTHKVQVFSMN